MTSHSSQNCKKMAYVEKICSVDLYSVEKAVEKLSMLCKILIYSYMFSLYYKSIEIHIYVAMLLTGVWIQYLQSSDYVLGLVLGLKDDSNYLNPISRNSLDWDTCNGA